MIQKPHAITRNFPLVGRSCYIAEWLRPKIYQYFVESDTNGRPFSRVPKWAVLRRQSSSVTTMK
jgi:hypothetical protein